MSSQLLITGVSDNVNNELTPNSIIHQIFDKLSAANLTNDILSIREFKGKKKQSSSNFQQTSHSFIINLKSTQVCNHVIDVKRHSQKLFAKGIFKTKVEIASERQIFIKEFLHVNVYNFLQRVKAKAHQLKIKYVWIYKGNIYAKRDENSIKIQITTEDDLKNCQ